jgi:hypothetical protein
MVAATYVSDLTDIYMWESGSTTDYGGGGQASSAGPDYAVEGTNATAKPISGSERGFMYDNTANFTIGADDHFFSWCLCSIPGLMATRDNRGLVMCIGDDTSNFMKFHLQGGDTLPFGGIQPYAVRFNNGTLANERTPVGTPSATPSWIGVGSNITATARFDNTAIDASRIGTGYDILNGTGADPAANLAGIATDDLVAAEGICVETSGGFKLLGKLRIGAAATACEFLDLNTNIFIVNSPHTLTDFTEILVEHASSILTLTNVNFIALGTNNPGRLEFLTATATGILTNIGFDGFGATVLSNNTTALGCRWINTATVTQTGATITGGSLTTGVASPFLSADSIDDVTGVTFVGDGTATPGHAVDLGNFAASATVNWDNILDDGSGGNTDWGGTAGTTVGVAGDADDAILVDVDSGFTLTIATTTASTIPSVQNIGPGTVIITANTVTVQVEVRDDDTGSLLPLAHVLLVKTSDYTTQVLNGATAAPGIVEDTTYAYTIDEDVEGWVRQVDTVGTDYEPVNIAGTIKAGGLFLVARLKPSS